MNTRDEEDQDVKFIPGTKAQRNLEVPKIHGTVDIKNAILQSSQGDVAEREVMAKSSSQCSPGVT